MSMQTQTSITTAIHQIALETVMQMKLKPQSQTEIIMMLRSIRQSISRQFQLKQAEGQLKELQFRGRAEIQVYIRQTPLLQLPREVKEPLSSLKKQRLQKSQQADVFSQRGINLCLFKRKTTTAIRVQSQLQLVKINQKRALKKCQYRRNTTLTKVLEEDSLVLARNLSANPQSLLPKKI